MDYVAIMERADRTIHSGAQTHLTEFVGTVDLYPVGEGDGSLAHWVARRSARQNPRGGCATPTACRGRSTNRESPRPPPFNCKNRQTAKGCVLMPVALQKWPDQRKIEMGRKDVLKHPKTELSTLP